MLRNQLVSLHRYPGNGTIGYVDFVNLDTGRITRIGPQFVLDATDLGDALPLAGTSFAVGQESRLQYGEPDAPLAPNPNWQQSFTYSFVVRWTQNATITIDKPADYDAFKSWGHYNLNYLYPAPRGEVTYHMFDTAPTAAGPFWSYRRFVAASSFRNNPQYGSDVSLINWSGNDYDTDNLIAQPPDKQAVILRVAKEYARGFLYWLQTECPRDDGSGFGYPELQPAGDELGGDGFAPAPYLRDSRRMLTETILTERDMIATPEKPDAIVGTDFFDSVGTAAYAIDLHPHVGEAQVLRQTLPYSIPLGAFIALTGPYNLIPASKDIGVSRLALASTRVHSTEWLVGEIAGNLAAFCLQRDVQPSDVRSTPALLSDFQEQLEGDGITIHCSTLQ
jgi:hypothetical protein